MKLQELKAEAERFAALIDAPTEIGFMPIWGPSEIEAPFVLRDADGHHLCFRERGQVDKRTFPTPDDLLFDVFQSITQSMADHRTRWERRINVDDRRRWFPMQLELMRRLSPDWGARQEGQQRNILRQYPFDDDALPRARMSALLREQGENDDAAWAKACQRYPLPAAS